MCLKLYATPTFYNILSQIILLSDPDTNDFFIKEKKKIFDPIFTSLRVLLQQHETRINKFFIIGLVIPEFHFFNTKKSSNFISYFYNYMLVFQRERLNILSLQNEMVDLQEPKLKLLCEIISLTYTPSSKSLAMGKKKSTHKIIYQFQNKDAESIQELTASLKQLDELVSKSAENVFTLQDLEHFIKIFYIVIEYNYNFFNLFKLAGSIGSILNTHFHSSFIELNANTYVMYNTQFSARLHSFIIDREHSNLALQKKIFVSELLNFYNLTRKCKDFETSGLSVFPKRTLFKHVDTLSNAALVKTGGEIDNVVEYHSKYQNTYFTLVVERKITIIPNSNVSSTSFNCQLARLSIFDTVIDQNQTDFILSKSLAILKASFGKQKLTLLYIQSRANENIILSYPYKKKTIDKIYIFKEIKKLKNVVLIFTVSL